MVRSWMARGVAVLFASMLSLGCGHCRHQQQCCCPCQSTASATAEKPVAPTTTVTAKQEPIPQLIPPVKSKSN